MAAEARQVARRKKGGLTDTALLENSRQFLKLKTEHSLIGARMKELRDRLIGWVEDNGTPDADGHFYLDLPEPVEGVVSFQRQRRVSQSLREEDLMALLEERGILDECTQMVRVLDEEAVYRAVFEGKISEKELTEFVDEKVTWALVPKRD